VPDADLSEQPDQHAYRMLRYGEARPERPYPASFTTVALAVPAASRAALTLSDSRIGYWTVCAASQVVRLRSDAWESQAS